MAAGGLSLVTRTEAELEIGLRYRRGEDHFDVTLHYDDPKDRVDRREFGAKPLLFDTAALNALIADDAKYGEQLTDYLFRQDPKVAEFFGETIAYAERDDYALHLRLLVDPRAPTRYHAIRWEALLDPRDGNALATKRGVMFSRYLSNADWRPVSPPARSDLRALIAIADPSGLDRQTSLLSGQPLPPIDAEAELARAYDALRGIETEHLEGPVTLRALVRRLEERARANTAIDILYLICHGRYLADDDGTNSGDSILFLENEDGSVARIGGRDLALRIGELPRTPTVAVLCSCQSAGDGGQDTLDAGAQSAFGPELAKRGVPAVVAMQGNISIDSGQRFLSTFFDVLRREGIVDRAVAAARADIENAPDWWMPVLFSRLRAGATYYLPEFGSRGDDVWSSILTAVDGGWCTPVIGSGLSSGIIGSREAMAERWVRRWQVPVARHARSDLAMVSQYLRVRTSDSHPALELSAYLLSELRQKYADVLSDEILTTRGPNEIISAVGELKRRENADDPFSVVASIRAPVYFTTSWTNLLEDALAESGRPAITRFFDWNHVEDEDNDEEFDVPTPEQPLVFHLFGTLAQPESLVISEEDYFTWLRAWIERRSFYDKKGFGRLLTRRHLMFLGYRLDDWDFRVLFQGIKSYGASEQIRKNRHVAVQISRESALIEPEAVQDYLDSYFEAERVHIYWGQASAFLTELARRRANNLAAGYE